MNIAFGCDRTTEARLDQGLAGLASFVGAREVVLNPMLPSKFVLAASYVKSFPQHAFTSKNGLNEGEYLMSPTCCYPVFHYLSDKRLPERMLFTHKNICFRCEGEYSESNRQGAYLMREYIILDEDPSSVRIWLLRVQRDVVDFLDRLGLKARVEKASDPFFDPNDLRQKFQDEQSLKSEFIVGDLAVGSLNLHLQAMSRNCRITGPKGTPLFSGCFGLGYDRVAGLIAEPANAA